MTDIMEQLERAATQPVATTLIVDAYHEMRRLHARIDELEQQQSPEKCGADRGSYTCQLPKGHDGVHVDGNCKWVDTPVRYSPGGGLVVPHTQ